jgi:hypothetical protein
MKFQDDTKLSHTDENCKNRFNAYFKNLDRIMD